MAADDQPTGYLVECYWPGVSAGKLAAAVERAERAADELRSQGRSLHFLGSILVPADEVVFCLFDGAEADVRAVSEKAGVPVRTDPRVAPHRRRRADKAGKMTVLPRKTAWPGRANRTGD